MRAEALIPGSALLREELTSPLIIGVIALVLAFSTAGFLYYRHRPGGRTKARLSLIVGLGTLALLLAIFVLTIQPGVNYGITFENGRIKVVFYGSESIELSPCGSNVSLIETNKALEMLSVRTNGIADPLSGVYMGYYKTRDGAEALVIVSSESSPNALLIETGDRLVIVGVPGVEKVYDVIVAYQAQECR